MLAEKATKRLGLRWSDDVNASTPATGTAARLSTTSLRAARSAKSCTSSRSVRGGGALSNGRPYRDHFRRMQNSRLPTLPHMC